MKTKTKLVLLAYVSVMITLVVVAACDKQEPIQKQIENEVKVLNVEAEAAGSRLFINGEEFYPINELDSHIVQEGDQIQVFSEDNYYVGGIEYFNPVSAKIKIDGLIVEQQNCSCSIHLIYTVN